MGTDATGSAALAILAYHRVLSAPDPLRPGLIDARTFRRQLSVLRHAFNVLPLREAARLLADNKLPARAVVITFDDGYADNASVALPILREACLPASFFVASGYLDGGCMWNDAVVDAVRQATAPWLDATTLGLERYRIDDLAQRRAAIAALIGALKYRPPVERAALAQQLTAAAGATIRGDLMMSSEQVRTLHDAGMEIGGHTLTHPILADLDMVAARNEIAAGRAQLEALTGEKVRSFAYPNGRPGRDYNDQTVAIVRELGFDVAVSTAWACARAGDDVLQLPRIGFADSSRLTFGARLLRSYR